MSMPTSSRSCPRTIVPSWLPSCCRSCCRSCPRSCSRSWPHRPVGARFGLRRRPAVVAVEAAALEHHADRAEHLAQRAAAGGAHAQRLVAERLHHLDVLAAVAARVLVGRHGASMLPGPPMAPSLPRRGPIPASSPRWGPSPTRRSLTIRACTSRLPSCSWRRPTPSVATRRRWPAGGRRATTRHWRDRTTRAPPTSTG